MIARGELIVIFDAEDRPDPDQLRTAAAACRDDEERTGTTDLACVQARLEISNAHQSFITRQFAFVLGAPLMFLTQPLTMILLLMPFDGLWVLVPNSGRILIGAGLVTLGAWFTLVWTAPGLRRGESLRTFLMLPACWVMHWIAAWRALHQLVRAPFVREKTPPGRAVAAARPTPAPAPTQPTSTAQPACGAHPTRARLEPAHPALTHSAPADGTRSVPLAA